MINIIWNYLRNLYSWNYNLYYVQFQKSILFNHELSFISYFYRLKSNKNCLIANIKEICLFYRRLTISRDSFSGNIKFTKSSTLVLNQILAYRFQSKENPGRRSALWTSLFIRPTRWSTMVRERKERIPLVGYGNSGQQPYSNDRGIPFSIDNAFPRMLRSFPSRKYGLLSSRLERWEFVELEKK